MRPGRGRKVAGAAAPGVGEDMVVAGVAAAVAAAMVVGATRRAAARPLSLGTRLRVASRKSKKASFSASLRTGMAWDDWLVPVIKWSRIKRKEFACLCGCVSMTASRLEWP